MADAILHALEAGDPDELRFLAAQAVELHSGIGAHEGSQRYFLHRVLRAVDLTTMLTTAMQRLRRGRPSSLTELELLLQRKELARLLEDFRRELAAQIADRLTEGRDPPPPTEPAMTRDLLALSAVELDELRRTVQPLARQLAARIGRRRRQQATGRLDARTTARRSLQSGGVPLDPAWRKRHPHRPEVVVLCDVSGSVAESAQFTFTLVHALHAELSRVRSFAFVDGIVEVTDLFADGDARHPRRPPARTARAHRRRRPLRLRPRLRAVLPAAPRRRGTPRTTVLVTGDARTNYRPAGVGALPQPLPAGPPRLLAQPRAPGRVGHRRLGHDRATSPAARASTRCGPCASWPTPSPPSCSADRGGRRQRVTSERPGGPHSRGGDPSGMDMPAAARPPWGDAGDDSDEGDGRTGGDRGDGRRRSQQRPGSPPAGPCPATAATATVTSDGGPSTCPSPDRQGTDGAPAGRTSLPGGRRPGDRPAALRRRRS